jgi:hypothetical protein
MSCKYLTTGKLECFESFGNTDAKLGEECSTKSCSEGICIAPYGSGRGLYCYNVIKKEEKGCEKSFAICNKGLKCKNDVCIKDSRYNQSSEKVVAKDSSAKSNKKDDAITISIGTSGLTILLYMLLGIVILICLIMLIFLMIRK